MFQTATTRQSGSGGNYAGPSVARLWSAFPEDARVIIERETRSVTRSAPARSEGWRLRFDRGAPRAVDPLMHRKTGVDPLAHLSLRFPDLASAICYAERHDLPYEVREEPRERWRVAAQKAFEEHATPQLCCWLTGPHALCCGNYPFTSERSIRSEARERRSQAPSRSSRSAGADAR